MALNEEQRSLLQIFKDVTHETNDQACLGTLEAFSWNIEDAINGFLATGHHAAPRRVAESPFSTATRRAPAQGAGARPATAGPFGYAGARGHQFGARAPAGDNQGGGVVAWIVYIILLPMRTIWRIIAIVVGPLFQAIGFSPAQPPTELELEESVRLFARKFEATYGFEHPEFFLGTYAQPSLRTLHNEQAVARAKQDLQPLVVYLHADDHQDTKNFCRGILCNPDFIDAVRGKCVFWANSIKSSEGWKAADALQVAKYPCLSIILALDSRLRLVGKLEGMATPQLVTQRTKEALDLANAETAVAKFEREERLMNQRLREEQDMAYQQALEQDREKERKRREEDARKQAEEEAKRKAEEDEEREIQEFHRKRKAALEAVPPEPGADEKNITNLTIKYPDGQRLQRRFRHSETIQQVYDFVAGQDPEEIDIPHEFVLCSNFPRREYGDHSLTLAEAGLTRAEMLMVHDLD